MATTKSLAVMALVISYVSAMQSKKPEYVNEWDKEVKFNCPDDQTIVQVHSRHSNNKEDRIWSFTCGRLPNNVPLKHCKQYAYVNVMKGLEVFQCPESGFLTGVYSKHSNKEEDRQTKYKCCDAPGYIAHSCQFTPFLNDYDEYLNYRVPDGYVLTGVMSQHSSNEHDRRWAYTICKLDKQRK